MKKIFELIWYWIAIWFIIIAFAFRSLSVMRKSKKYSKNKDAYLINDRYKIVHKLIKNVFFIKRITPRYSNFNHLIKKPTLFVCNHKSLVDPMVVFEALYEQEGTPFPSFVYKNDLNKSKLLKAALTLIDCIALDRNDMRQQFEAYNLQNDLVHSGRSIIIFIEGTRIQDHQFGEYKAGALRVAYKNFMPICPIVIFGTNKLDKKFKKVFEFKIKNINVVALDLIKPTNFVNVKINIISERLKEAMWTEYQKQLKNFESKIRK